LDIEWTVVSLEQLQFVLRAQEGDKDAFVRLIRMSEKSMYQAAKAILQADSDCADAIQETILKAYRSVKSLREPEFFKTWLIRILIHECNRILQHKRNVIPFQTSVERGEQDPNYSNVELMDAVRSLEKDLRIVIHLYYFCDWPIKEIAEALDLPEGTIKSRLYRAREELKERLYHCEKRGVDHS